MRGGGSRKTAHHHALRGRNHTAVPRIRTFKPEFFRSPDTAKASPMARLLYMAMWSWANDEGIGETNLYGLLGFAFPDSDELTVKDLQRLLKEIQSVYKVEFYVCRGRHFYSIPTWELHQKTERRAAGKFPKPDDAESTPDLRFGKSADSEGFSSDALGSSSLGTGEQGNTGTGEIKEGVGSGSTEGHQSAETVPPPKKCFRHLNDPKPPSCPACGDAREANREWHTDRELEARRQKEADAQHDREIRDAIHACNECDQNGKSDYGDSVGDCPNHPSLKDLRCA